MSDITAAISWPDTLKLERAVSWMPDFGNQVSPTALDGTRQYRNTNGGGLWRVAFNSFHLSGREAVLAWQAMEVKLRGGLVPVVIFTCTYRPKAVTGPVPSIEVRSVGIWAARSISGRIDLVNSTELEPGMYFSRNHDTYGWRLYRVETTAAVSGSGTQRDITFWPPLRAALDSNTNLTVQNPRCVMRLASSNSMDVEIEPRSTQRGNPSAEFVEAF